MLTRPDSDRPELPRPAPQPLLPTQPAPAGVDDGPLAERLGEVVEHLNTLSQLITGTSRASAAERDALGHRIEQAVADLDTLQLRVLRSLAAFDSVRLRVQKELADRPPLTDGDIDRIAAAVTDRLLDHVRVETEVDREFR